MIRSLTDILSDLGEVQDQMIALPADDFASRVDLLVRQDHLRSEMGEARRELADALEADIDVGQLRARVVQLERVVEQQEGRVLWSSAKVSCQSAGTAKPRFPRPTPANLNDRSGSGEESHSLARTAGR